MGFLSGRPQGHFVRIEPGLPQIFLKMCPDGQIGLIFAASHVGSGRSEIGVAGRKWF
jgi:hypothetical protein